MTGDILFTPAHVHVIPVYYSTKFLSFLPFSCGSPCRLSSIEVLFISVQFSLSLDVMVTVKAIQTHGDLTVGHPVQCFEGT